MTKGNDNGLWVASVGEASRRMRIRLQRSKNSSEILFEFYWLGNPKLRPVERITWRHTKALASNMGWYKNASARRMNTEQKKILKIT